MTARKKLKKLEWHLAERIGECKQGEAKFHEHGEYATARGIRNMRDCYERTLWVLEEKK